MQIFLLVLLGLLLITAIMAVGVLMGRKPISGSCGGVGAALGEKDYTCEICGGDEAKCEEQNASSTSTQKSARTNFYNADS
ncbi:MAG: (Na+)-NQR maturation NqrM [Pseudomonadales bacterium]